MSRRSRLVSLGSSALWTVFPFVVLLGWRRFDSGALSLVLYWPTLVSAALLISFGRTLFYPPSMVERFARLQKPDLGEAEIAYCRRVTQIWCLFFTGNGLLALYLALRSSLKAWALYAGMISYVLVGVLFSLEYLYRHWRFRPEGSFLTGWLNRCCPTTRP